MNLNEGINRVGLFISIFVFALGLIMIFSSPNNIISEIILLIIFCFLIYALFRVFIWIIDGFNAPLKQKLIDTEITTREKLLYTDFEIHNLMEDMGLYIDEAGFVKKKI